MSATEETIEEPTEETIEEPTEETIEEPTEEKKESKFQINNWDDLKRMWFLAMGKNPDAVQAIAKFMDLDNPVERTYLPDKLHALAISQLTGYGKVLYKNDDWNPFTLIAECISIGYSGYKGFKSNQFVDITRQTTNLKDLQGVPEETKQSFLKGLWSRGGNSD